MSFPALINRILSPLNLAVTRRSTLSRVSEDLAAYQTKEKIWHQQHQGEIENLRMETLRGQISMQWRIIDHHDDLIEPGELLECELCGFEGNRKLFREYRSHCIFGGGKLLRHQCPECDVIFGAAKMLDLTDEQLKQEYELHYSVYQEGDSTAQELRAFHSLNPTKDGIYLNYGAGAWSRSVSELRADGWNVFAYEPHESAAAGDHAVTSQEQLATMKFDGIFSNNVLEHFRHPVEELKNISGYLKPQGKMAHATPCFEYLYEYTRFHLFFFPGRSRSLLARNAGLKVEDFVEDGEFMNIIFSRTSE